MPKLVHKDKVERQKGYNYTAKHDKLQKNVQDMKEGKIEPLDPKELLIASGYTEKSAISTLSHPDRHSSVIEIIEEVWPVKKALQDVQRITNKAEQSKQLATALKGLDMRFKLTGAYAASRTEMEVSGTVTHEHDLTLGGKDYLEYKKDKLKDREVIDGEIID